MSTRVLASTLLAAFGVVVYQESKGGTWPPRPSRFWGVVVAWTMLAILGSVAPELAAALSVAAVLGVYFRALPGTGGSAGGGKPATQQQISQASAQNAAGAAQPGGSHPGTSFVPF